MSFAEQFAKLDAEAQRLAVRQMAFDGMNARSIAEITGLSIDQIRTAIAEKRAAEIRILAETKGGLLLKAMTKAKGGKPYRSNGATGKRTQDTLADLRLTKDQSSRWQQLAKNPKNNLGLSKDQSARWHQTPGADDGP